MSTKLPPLGISLAETFRGKINEELVCKAADAMVSRGLADAGYKYLIIGDDWEAKSRDSESGAITADTAKFPGGLASVADYLHERGLRLGVVSSIGMRTSGGYPGIFNNEFADIEKLAADGVDYIAFENHALPTKTEISTLLRRVGMAVRVTGRDIYYTVSSDSAEMYKWIRTTGANAFINTLGTDSVGGAVIDESCPGYSAPYCWNSGRAICIDTNCGSTKNIKSALAILSVISSPIIIDTDVISLSDEVVSIITNPYLIAINQDDEGRSAFRIGEGDARVYCKLLPDLEYALVYINNGEYDASAAFNSYDFGLTFNAGYSCELTDVFTGEKSVECSDYIEIALAPGEVRVFKMRLV